MIVSKLFYEFYFFANEFEIFLFQINSLGPFINLKTAYRAATDHSSSSGSSHIRLIESAFQYLLKKKMFCADFVRKMLQYRENSPPNVFVNYSSDIEKNWTRYRATRNSNNNGRVMRRSSDEAVWATHFQHENSSMDI